MSYSTLHLGNYWTLTKLGFRNTHYKLWHAVAQLVEALRYKPEGRWFDFRWSH